MTNCLIFLWKTVHYHSGKFPSPCNYNSPSPPAILDNYFHVGLLQLQPPLLLSLQISYGRYKLEDF